MASTQINGHLHLSSLVLVYAGFVMFYCITVDHVIKGSASFSSGWLHFAVQCFFAVLIVASFILVIMMTIPGYSHPPATVPNRPPRCHTKNCIVMCEHVPYFGRYEEDIVYSVSKLPDVCTEFHLELRNPMFVDETVPTGWLPRMRIPIHELTIYGGNLKHLTSGVFLNQQAASIRTLVLYKLNIKTWTRDSLVGLSNLAELYIKKCTLGNLGSHVLRPVHDTLRSLTTIHSDEWDPANFTGTTALTSLTRADFSHNAFYDVLGKNSFTSIENCKILYLNSCRITAIGFGAFDNLRSIETLFLNDNHLVTVPVGLFSSILSITNIKPRINLQDNKWQCDCAAKEIRQLVSKDMLLTDPDCHSPDAFKGETFSTFYSYCEDDMKSSSIIQPAVTMIQFEKLADISGFVYINDGCHNGQENSSSTTFRMLSPVFDRPCVSTKIQKSTIGTIASTRKSGQIMNESTWIKFTFIVKTNSTSMVQITATEANDYGILWFQSSCPNEVYCVNSMPETLRVYNVDLNAKYIFCPILLISGAIEHDRCVLYNLAIMDDINIESALEITFYVCTGGICLIVGATCVYALVRKNPTLLRGSKRILFVKHKNVDALVLPPKVPLRNELVDDVAPEFNDKKIFILPTNSHGIGKFNRNKSTRSSKSNAPSYISALQPTEEQLEEWRIQNHPATTDHATYSWICSAESFQYMDVIDNDKTYESIK